MVLKLKKKKKEWLLSKNNFVCKFKNILIVF